MVEKAIVDVINAGARGDAGNLQFMVTMGAVVARTDQVVIIHGYQPAAVAIVNPLIVQQGHLAIHCLTSSGKGIGPYLFSV